MRGVCRQEKERASMMLGRECYIGVSLSGKIERC